MVCDSLLYHPTLLKLIKFIDSTPKREKSFRLVAYLSRFLSYYLARQGFLSETVQIFKTLKAQITLTRKGMRFLKPLNHLETALKAYDNKLTDSVLKITTIIRNLGYAAYLSVDLVVWFKLLGVLDHKKAPNAALWALRFWLVGLVAGLVNDLRVWQINSTKLKTVGADEKTDIKEIEKKLFGAKRKLVWDALDTFICLNSLNYLHFTEGDVGLAGVITSVMGLKDLWAAT